MGGATNHRPPEGCSQHRQAQPLATQFETLKTLKELKVTLECLEIFTKPQRWPSLDLSCRDPPQLGQKVLKERSMVTNPVQPSVDIGAERTLLAEMQN